MFQAQSIAQKHNCNLRRLDFQQESVIRDNNIIELEKGYDIDIIFNYNDIKDVDYILGNSRIINKSFDENITYNVYVNKSVLDKLSKYNTIINKEIYIEKK